MIFNDTVEVKEIEVMRDMFYNNKLLLRYTIKYPQLFSVFFQNALNGINLYYRQIALKFQTYCEEELFKAAVDQYQYTVTNNVPIRYFEAQLVNTVTYNQNCVISLYFDQYEFAGGAHGSTIRFSDTWSVQEGSQYSLGELFPHNFDYKAYIIKYIDEQIAMQIDAGKNQYFEDYTKLIVEKFDERNFYLVNEGIVFYYQEYDIAPYAAGIVQFLIPYANGKPAKPQCR